MNCSPVLLICYNRPLEFIKLFNKVKKLQNRKIYIFQDGKKKNDSNWDKLNSLIKKNKNKSKIKIKYLEKNLGCKYGVKTALDWFFKNNSQGIILEDDCLPSNSFFKYCDVLLNRFKNEKKIKAISGYNFMNDYKKKYSYSFTKHVEVWGWATWRNVWREYDLKMPTWKIKGDKILNKRFRQNMKLKNAYKIKFDLTYRNKIDTWDHQFVYQVWRSNGLIVTPKINLVYNSGFNSKATHTKKKNIFLQKKANQLKFPLSHQKKIKEDKNLTTLMDNYYCKNIFKKKKNKLNLEYFLKKINF